MMIWGSSKCLFIYKYGDGMPASPLKMAISAICLTFSLSTTIFAANEQMRFPQNKQYGLIRPSGSYQSLANNIKTMYETYKANFLKENQGDYYIYSTETFGSTNIATVSEAHGFGMMIFALMAGYDENAKTYFDGMVGFWERFRMGNNLMAWKIDTDFDAVSWGSATDGDLDIAYAFLLAYEQWGDSQYLSNALAVIDGLSSNSINGSNLPRIDDGGAQDAISRPSDWMTSHFRSFGEYDDGYNWQLVVSSIYSTFNNFVSSYSSSTGLISDFTSSGAPLSIVIETQYDDEYYYNACRVPMRFAMDYARSNNNNAKTILSRIGNWIESEYKGNIENIKSGYTLEGSPIDNYNSIEYMAPFGCALIATNHQSFLDDLWNEIQKSYMHAEATAYGSAINLLSMIVMSGNWWVPGDDDTYEDPIVNLDGVIIDNFCNSYGDDNAQSFLGALNGLNWGDNKYGGHAGDTTYHYGGGYWYGYAAGGATIKSNTGTVIFDDGDNKNAKSELIVKDSLLNVTFDIPGSNSSKYDYAALELPIIADVDNSGNATDKYVNLSKLSGITIKYKSSDPVRFAISTEDASNLEYGNYGFTLPASSGSFNHITLSLQDIKAEEYSPLDSLTKALPDSWGWDVSGKNSAMAISFTVGEEEDNGANVDLQVQEIIFNGMDYSDFGLTYRPSDPVNIGLISFNKHNFIKTSQNSKDLKINLNLEKNSNVKLKLFNIAGKEIKTVDKNYSKGSHNIKIEGSAISSGRYFLHSVINGKKSINCLNFIR